MKQYGMIKTLKVSDDEELKLCGNALTFILYKSYFGRDLLNDIIGFAKKNSNKDTLEKLKEYNIESVSDIEKLNDEQTTDVLNTMQNYEFDSEFILNFIASLIAIGAKVGFASHTRVGAVDGSGSVPGSSVPGSSVPGS